MLTVHSILLAAISVYLQLLCISKEYYNQSGYQFLREYGQHYNLFSTFLNDNGTTSITHSSTGSKLESIHHIYKIRDYANYSTWEHISFADIKFSRTMLTVEKATMLLGPALNSSPIKT